MADWYIYRRSVSDIFVKCDQTKNKVISHQTQSAIARWIFPRWWSAFDVDCEVCISNTSIQHTHTQLHFPLGMKTRAFKQMKFDCIGICQICLVNDLWTRSYPLGVWLSCVDIRRLNTVQWIWSNANSRVNLFFFDFLLIGIMFSFIFHTYFSPVLICIAIWLYYYWILFFLKNSV